MVQILFKDIIKEPEKDALVSFKSLEEEFNKLTLKEKSEAFNMVRKVIGPTKSVSIASMLKAHKGEKYQ